MGRLRPFEGGHRLCTEAVRDGSLYHDRRVVDQGKVNMYEYDDEEEGGRSTGRIVGAIVGVVALALIGFFVLRSRGGGDDGSTSAESVNPVEASAPAAGSDDTEPDDTAAGNTEPGRSSEGPIGTDASPTTKTVEVDADAATSTTADPTTTAAPPPVTTAPPPPPPSAPPGSPAPLLFDALSDGTPVPVLVLYDVNQITLTGAVPDQVSRDRLQVLAIANAKPGQDAAVANLITINPNVPPTVGVRVVELTSTRFPEGSADILPPHALELDRIAAIMNALPNITVLVIGHADQRGDEVQNYQISAARADAVVDYLVAQGIAPSRLSSRAVGEQDLLTLNNDDAALALNRRTEIVLSGLLQP